MNQVTVLTEELVETLRTNRTAHIAEHAEALEAFRTKAVEKLKKAITKVEAGEHDPRFVNVSLPVPESHEKDYDTAISMIEMAMRAGQSTIELTAHDYEQYVLDDWGWKENFAATNSIYLAAGN